MAHSLSAPLAWGQPFVISYSGWPSTPNGTIQLTDPNGRALPPIAGAVNATSASAGTITGVMPSFPANGGVPWALTTPGVTMRLS